MAELFVEKYFPRDFSAFIGNNEIVSRVRAWATGWSAGQPQKPLFLHGPPGCGKTCLALLVARVHGWQVFEMNASDVRSKDAIERLAGAAAQAQSFSGKPRLVLLDEVDGLQARNDRGGAAAIAAVIRESRNPVILTANDIYADQKLSVLRAVCEPLQFRKVNYLSIAKRFREISESEGIACTDDVLKELAQRSAGDVRSALLDLQSLCLQKKISLPAVRELGFREREENIFSVMDVLFKSRSFSEIREWRLKSEVNEDLLLRWVEENIPRILNKGQDTARAFNQLSKADVFNGRISRRQYYGFLRYSSDLMSAGVVLSREHDYHGWLRFQFPGLLRKLSASAAKRQFLKGLAGKIGAKTHASVRQVMVEDFPFLRMICREPEAMTGIAAACDLDEKEIAFLMGSSPETKKVQKVFAQAQVLKAQQRAGHRKQLRGMAGVFFEEELGEKEPHVSRAADTAQPAGSDVNTCPEPGDSREKQTRLF